ncbi:hypothetical protein [Pararhodospirillum photometricum]|uniref:hypothetical protein n=1 Tax=Pararhodospirillum photometricum TaxID=1084 RepID=UPI0002DB6E8B|nr:hypothetical protein [Pararhodospirillum photometricum]
MDLIAHGLTLARDAGVIDPTPEAAVWELLVEAADTLRRLPDQERAWLLSCERCQWPEVVRTQAERWANAVAAGGWEGMKTRPGPPTREAISRMDALFEVARSIKKPADARRAFLMAAGVPVWVIARKTTDRRDGKPVSRPTIYASRARALAALAVTVQARGMISRAA